MSATIYHQLQTIFSYKLYTISYIQIAVFKTWNDIPWKASQLILDSQFMEVSSPVKHHHQQGSRRSSHGEPRDVLQQSAVIQFQKSGTNRSQTEQSSHWVSCKRCCSQRERVHTIHNELVLHSGASTVNVVETTRKEIGTLHCSYWCLANFPVGKIKLSIWLGIACIFNDFSRVVHVFNCPKLSGLPTLRKIYWVKSSLRLNVLRMRSCPTEHSPSQFFCSVPTVGTLRAPFACSNAYSLLFICVMCVWMKVVYLVCKLRTRRAYLRYFLYLQPYSTRLKIQELLLHAFCSKTCATVLELALCWRFYDEFLARGLLWRYDWAKIFCLLIALLRCCASKNQICPGAVLNLIRIKFCPARVCSCRFVCNSQCVISM